MSSTSVGTGAPGDSNENPAPDSRPSKTLGAESGPDKTDTLADVLQPGELLRSVPAPGVPVDPDYHPDGPNVAPSPWEADAARGKT